MSGLIHSQGQKQEKLLRLSIENLTLLDPVKPCSIKQASWIEGGVGYSVVPQKWATVPAFVEDMEYNDILLTWANKIPDIIYLIHEMAIPEDLFLLRPKIKGTKPDIAPCDHSTCHSKGDPVCIKSLWQLAISIDRPGHRVTIIKEKNKALIMTYSGAFWVTLPMTDMLPITYAPGIFAKIKPEVENT